jgi:uncharacterized membrane protein
LEIYERIYPGAAKAVFDAFAEEQRHRHEMEYREIEQQERKIRNESHGLASGVAICVLSLFACVALALFGAQAVAIAVVAIPLASVVKALRGK